MPKFLPTGGFKWMDLNLEYSKEVRELNNNYILAPDKTDVV